MSLGSNLKRPIKCVSLNNQPRKVERTIVNINSDKTLFYPFTVGVNKCGGSCNTVDDGYAGARIPNKVKIMNVKVFNLMSSVNETKSLVRRESWKCKFGFNEILCNSKEKWKPDEVGLSVKN